MAGIDFTTRVREVPDFPEPGVGFKDISPLLLDPEALRQAVGELAAWTRERRADLVLGAEARGFWLGPAIASTVPPVASTSSWMTTRAPPPIASAATSSVFWPYSSA